MADAWESLQSGSDIRGIAITTPEHTVNLTTDNVQAIAGGFVQWLSQLLAVRHADLKIAVGMDSRLSGPALRETLAAALAGFGCTVYDCQLSTTPAMFMSTVMPDYQCHGAIMVTASHLPFYYNGLKFFTAAGGCEKADIKTILQNAASGNVPAAALQPGAIVNAALIDDYAALLVTTIRERANQGDQPLASFKIVVDAGNGAGGFFAAGVLRPLGADTTGSQFLEPDGTFPNHPPNPENREAMAALKQAVLEHKADLGIIFDADGDRAAVVGPSGLEINKNALIALLAVIVLEQSPHSTIVTDSITSTGLTEFIASLGGNHHRFKRGYKNVINEAKRLNQQGEQCQLAIETSGHGAFKENYFLDDGAYIIAKILVKMAQLHQQGGQIETLIAALKAPCESTEQRVAITVPAFKDYGTAVLAAVEAYAATVSGWHIVPNNYEGIRVTTDEQHGNGWFLLRLSLHEPVLALNIEADTAGGVQLIADQLLPFLQTYDGLHVKTATKG